MDRLLPELIPSGSIATHLDSKDLQSFALTCREFNEAARQLFEWKVYGFGPCLAFLDLLLRDEDDDNHATPLLPAAIRNLAIDPKDSAEQGFMLFMMGKEPTDGPVGLAGRTFAIILGLCTNVGRLRVTARNGGTFQLSASEQAHFMKAIATMDQLRKLDLDYCCYFPKVLHHAAKRFEHLTDLDICLKVMGPPQFGTNVLPLKRLRIKTLFVAFGDCTTARYVKLAETLFVPSLRVLRVSITPCETLGLVEFTQSMDTLPSSTLVVFRVESNDAALATVPVTVSAPQTHLFSTTQSNISPPWGSKFSGCTFIGPWHRSKAQGAELLFKPTGGAEDKVWVRMGDSMGDAEFEELEQLRRQHGKELVLF